MSIILYRLDPNTSFSKVLKDTPATIPQSHFRRYGWIHRERIHLSCYVKDSWRHLSHIFKWLLIWLLEIRQKDLVRSMGDTWSWHVTSCPNTSWKGTEYPPVIIPQSHFRRYWIHRESYMVTLWMLRCLQHRARVSVFEGRHRKGLSTCPKSCERSPLWIFWNAISTGSIMESAGLPACLVVRCCSSVCSCFVSVLGLYLFLCSLPAHLCLVWIESTPLPPLYYYYSSSYYYYCYCYYYYYYDAYSAYSDAYSDFDSSEALTHRSFYTRTHLHTKAFTDRRVDTQALFHTAAFAHRRFYTQRLSRHPSKKLSPSRVKDLWCFLHTDAFTHRSFYTQKLFHTKAFPASVPKALPQQSDGFLVFFSTQTLLHTGAFTHKSFYTHKRVYTQKLLHTEAFTHRTFDTPKLLHTNAFTRRSFYTQKLLHTEVFTHRSFYTQSLLHTEALTHRSFYTQKLWHRFDTQNLLHTEAFTHSRFYTRKLWHTEAFTHRSFDTQNLLHTEPFTHRRFTHRRFYTQNLLHTQAVAHRSFCSSPACFRSSAIISSKGNGNNVILPRAPTRKVCCCAFSKYTFPYCVSNEKHIRHNIQGDANMHSK